VGIRIEGLGLKVSVSKFRDQGSEIRDEGYGVMVWGGVPGARVVGLRAQGLEHEVEGLGLRLWACRLCVFG